MKPWLLAILLTSCAAINPGTPTPRSMTPIEPTMQTWKRAASADAVAIGLVTKVEDDWDYGTTCGIIERIRGCQDQDAWRITVKGRKTWYFWAFPPPGNYLPIAKGMSAVFLLNEQWIVPWSKCHHMGQMANACTTVSGENALVIGDTLDILPLSDSALVDSLREKK